MFEKLTTWPKPNLLSGKNSINIATFNDKTLISKPSLLHLQPKRIWKSYAYYKIDICELEPEYYESDNGWRFTSVSAWKNTVNDTVERVEMLYCPRAFKITK